MALAHVEPSAPDDPQLGIGDRIRHQRVELGLDQDHLAVTLGVSRPLISKWERGKSLPNVDQAVRLADALKCSFGWLCGVPLRSRCCVPLSLLSGHDGQLELLDEDGGGWNRSPELVSVP